jgi:hypothetical protein
MDVHETEFNHVDCDELAPRQYIRQQCEHNNTKTSYIRGLKQ